MNLDMVLTCLMGLGWGFALGWHTCCFVRRRRVVRIERELHRQMQAALGQLFGARQFGAQPCDCEACVKLRSQKAIASN
jgi:hypothetical protein